MPRPLLEFADSSESVLVLPIAEQFFQELQLFGRMGLGASKSAVLDTYRRERFTVITSFLRSLEVVRGLRFRADSRQAYCLLSDPPRGGSVPNMFGYTGDPDGPLPTDVAHSLMAFWEAQVQLGQAPHPAAAATVAHLARQGYHDAVNYLFDLNESGYLNLTSLSLLSSLLINGRALADSDDELVALLTGARLDAGKPDTEWLTAAFEFAWLDGEEAAAAFPELLVQRAWNEVHALRECQTLDDWAAQLFATAPALTCMLGLLNGRAGIAVKAATAQLEEISADLGGPWMDQRSGIGLITIVGTVMLATNHTAQRQAGGDWGDRAYAERAVVPQAVFSGITEGAEWSRDDWFQLSWRTIVPWAAHFRPGEPVADRRGSYDGIAADNLHPKKRPKLSKAIAPVGKLFSSGRYADAVELLRPLKEHYPYAGPLYDLLAMNLDNSGAHAEALEHMLPAVILDPTMPQVWQTCARVAYTNGCEFDAMVLEGFGTLFEQRKGGSPKI